MNLESFWTSLLSFIFWRWRSVSACLTSGVYFWGLQAIGSGGEWGLPALFDAIDDVVLPSPAGKRVFSNGHGRNAAAAADTFLHSGVLSMRASSRPHRTPQAESRKQVGIFRGSVEMLTTLVFLGLVEVDEDAGIIRLPRRCFDGHFCGRALL